MGSEEPARSSQSDSMAAIFSWSVISFRGRLFDMPLVYNGAGDIQRLYFIRTREI